MANVLKAMQAKSDQLNYVDIGAKGEIVATFERVIVTDSEQPVSVFYNGCSNRPWKPSKGMIRLLAAAWGEDTDYWIGKTALLYGEPTARWAGKEVGGVRIRALSDIDKKGLTEFIQISSAKRIKQTIPFFDMSKYISKDDQVWVDAVRADISVLDQINNPEYKEKIRLLV